MGKTWRLYEEMRPDELAEIVRQAPIAYWPLGLLEHHGWHLPIGFDGLKARAICLEAASQTGGVVLPIMWWGADGGHGDFRWTHYQPPQAAGAIAQTTVRQLIGFGFRAIIVLPGHYPWQQILDASLRPLAQQHPLGLLLWGLEGPSGKPDLHLPGDHAAREETSYGLALLPQLVDLFALRPGRTVAETWPGGDDRPARQPAGKLRLDAADPLFSQLGEDARTATAERGRRHVDQLVDYLVKRVSNWLSKPPAG